MSTGSAPQPTVNLKSNQLADKISASVAANVVMQAYVQTIRNQPLIQGVTALPNLPAHQQTAIDHANYWANTLQSQVIQLQDDINGFCNNFLSFYNPLLALANQIVGGDTTKVAEFNVGLAALETQVATNQGSANTVFTNLNGFESQDLAPDVQSFLSDYQTATTTILGDNGELKELQSELDATSSAITKDNTLIAVGATGAVVGILVICVGALAEFETAGLSTGLIVAGVAITAGGTAAAIAGGVDLSKQNSRYKDLTQQIATLNGDVNALTTAKSQIQGFLDALQAAEAAVQQVADEWGIVKANFATLQNQLVNNVSVTSPFLVPELNAAQLDWQDLKNHVQQLESFKNVPTTNQTANQITAQAA